VILLLSTCVFVFDVVRHGYIIVLTTQSGQLKHELDCRNIQITVEPRGTKMSPHRNSVICWLGCRLVGCLASPLQRQIKTRCSFQTRLSGPARQGIVLPGRYPA
jgi:hypothetical protein